MTASSTLCSKKTPDSLSAQGMRRRALSLMMLAALASVAVQPLGAQSQELSQPYTEHLSPEMPAGVQLHRDGDALMLTATLNWALPDLVQDALLKGIPVHFIAEADMLQERWWWSDQQLLSASRYMRLSYQPLTRRWRLYNGNQPFEGQGLGVALSSTFETLEEAVQSMQRIVRWRIGEMSALPGSGTAVLQLRFRIDLSHFPRPLQIGALGRTDWNLLVTQRERVELGQL
ncbi:MAG TPA: DUF4390 domain-containing protein [Comamonas sp.]